MEIEWSFFYGEDAPFVKVLSLQHILYLAVCGVIAAVFLHKRRWVRDNAQIVGKVFLGIMIFQQIVLLYGWYAVITGFDLSTALPLHISRVTSLVTILFLLTKKRYFLDIVCYFSIFALISLFYPKNVYHFAHVNGISYMVNHLISILVPVLGVLGYNWRPTWASYRNAAIGFACYFPAALLANALTENGNYFYQTDRPFLSDLSGWQFGALSFFGTLLGFGLLPFIYNLKKQR